LAVTGTPTRYDRDDTVVRADGRIDQAAVHDMSRRPILAAVMAQ
jgi:hypothetical protein